MFIRKKNIRNKKTGAVYSYAYAVENRWRKKGARQKVGHYLGKVYSFLERGPIEFFGFAGVGDSHKEEFLKTSSAKSLIQKLVEWELSVHSVLGFSIDLEGGGVSKDGRPASIEINEGMLNTFTLRRLLLFKPEDEEAGYELAKAFVEAGIRVPQEVFVVIFGKMAEKR